LAGDLAGDGHFGVAAPVTDSAALRQAAVQIEQRCGRCDVLVNCAGTTRFVAHANLPGLDDALFDSIFAVNVRGAFAGVRALEEMLARSDLPGGGVIVNISSIAAVTAMGSNVAYCASKAALDNMTRSLARALAPRIRVLSVSPGLVDTDFIQSLEPAWRDEQAARTPLRRLAQPAEVGRAVVAAVTQLTFTTGSIIAVDGGRPLA
jgi:3-oxoacyl-[acyl-carrier protein] reductase